MRRLLVLTLLTLLACAALCGVSRSAPNAILDGYVLSADGVPLQGFITLDHALRGQTPSTDLDGYYYVDTGGHHTVSVYAKGFTFSPDEVEVDISPQGFRLNFSALENYPETPTPPDPPVNPRVVLLGKRAATVAWDNTPRATSYRVTLHRSRTTTNRTWTLGSASTGLQFKGLAPKTDYQCKIEALNATGTSEPAFTAFRTKKLKKKK